MRRFCKSIVFGLQILVLGISSVVAQDKQITFAQFLVVMDRSDKATKNIPFRERVTFETSDSSGGPWEPYSSYVSEAILPDRYHIVHAGDPIIESIQIGKVHFKRRADGLWDRSEPGAPGPTHPARVPYFRKFNCRIRAENDMMVVTCLEKSKPRLDNDTDTSTHKFWFDDKGVLFKRETIVFTSRNWSRQVVLYEYDPSIRIEAP